MTRIDRIRDLYKKARPNPLRDYETITLADHNLLVILHRAWPKIDALIKATDAYFKIRPLGGDEVKAALKDLEGGEL